MCGWIAFAAGTALSVLGTVQQGKYQAKMASYNAQVADNNRRIAERQAQDALDRGRVEEQRHRLQVSRLKGTQRAALAGSGFDVTFGSPLDVLSDTEAFGELDALTIRANAEREAFGFRVQAADLAAQRGRFQAGRDNAKTASLLSGATTLADRWYQWENR